MRLFRVLPLLALLFAIPASAQQAACNCIWLGDIKATTSIASATSLSSLAPGGATYAVIQAVGGPLYGTYDGSTPSSSNYDITLTVGQSYPVSGAGPISKLKIIGANLAGNFFK